MNASSIVAILLLVSSSALSDEMKDELEKFKQLTAGRGNNQQGKETSHCPQTAYRFPYDNQVTDYLRVKTDFPYMTEISVCFILTRSGANVNGADNEYWISYANSRTDHAFAISFQKNVLKIAVMGAVSQLAMPTMEPDVEYHMCIVSFAKTLGTTYVFLDGRLVGVANIQPSAIYGWGVLILAQDQDRMGGKFASNQSASGKIYNFMMWTRVLEHDEIVKMHEDHCWCPSDRLVTLDANNVQLYGGASAISPLSC